ncbi:MAG: GTPase RsgA, partial [Vulcanimicrobiaceae bacterium]
MSETHLARVLSIGKNVAWIVLDAESVPRLATLKRTTGPRSMLAPGDAVRVRLLEEGRVLVESLEPRSFSLERRTAGGRSKTMAANVDTLVTVTSLANPPPRLAILDQLLAFAELEAIEALLVFTKPDLVRGSERAELLASYAALGYTALAVNPKAGDGVEALRISLQ